MHTEKLLKLAQFLESDSIKDEWFDIRTWAQKGWSEKKCGTTACAVGWATTIFPELSLIEYEQTSCAPKRIVPYYNGYSDWEATQEFFDLTEKESNYLFLDEGYYYLDSNHWEINEDFWDGKERVDITRFDVANRLKEVVEHGFPSYIY